MLKDLFRIPIRNAQDKIEKEYNKKGLTDEVLDAQTALNRIRHALDIPDENEIDEGYVQ